MLLFLAVSLLASESSDLRVLSLVLEKAPSLRGSFRPVVFSQTSSVEERRVYRVKRDPSLECLVPRVEVSCCLWRRSGCEALNRRPLAGVTYPALLVMNCSVLPS